MHNLIGKPAEGEDFFDRERELRQVWDRLETDNVLLLAARRVGKTSLMYRLRDRAEPEGFHATYDLPLSDPIKAHIRERTGWLIPYHLQLIFATLREHMNDRRPRPTRVRVTIADVDAVYEQLLSPSKRAYFDYWEQRLHEELGAPDDRLALDLLDAVARNPAGESAENLKGVLTRHLQDGTARDDKLRHLLDVLQADGYLAAAGGRFLFRSSLLRDFWPRR